MKRDHGPVQPDDEAKGIFLPIVPLLSAIFSRDNAEHSMAAHVYVEGVSPSADLTVHQVCDSKFVFCLPLSFSAYLTSIKADTLNPGSREEEEGSWTCSSILLTMALGVEAWSMKLLFAGP